MSAALETKNCREHRRGPIRERIARAVLLLAVFVLSFFIAVAALQPNLLINTLGCRPLIVSSDSMSPRLNRGDVVGVVRADIGELKVGDIIAVSPATNFVVVHYLADKRRDTDGGVLLKTKRYGVDEPKDWDYWGITREQVIGKVGFVIPKIGHAVFFARSVPGIITLVGCALGIWAISAIRRAPRGSDGGRAAAEIVEAKRVEVECMEAECAAADRGEGRHA